VEDLRAATTWRVAGKQAAHAEVLSVPVNLCTPGAGGRQRWESAAFATIGAIALQGVRQARPTLGEASSSSAWGWWARWRRTVQGHGCRVIGLDSIPPGTALAQQLGADQRW